MKEEIKYEHFKDTKELLEHIKMWMEEDDYYYTRWFGLNDLNNLRFYIENLQSQLKAKEEENEQLKLKVDNLAEKNIPFVKELKEKEQQLKEVIKEAREQLEKELEYSKTDCVPARKITCEKILEILSKGENK